MDVRYNDEIIMMFTNDRRLIPEPPKKKNA